jgi:hypothetical protein
MGHPLDRGDILRSRLGLQRVLAGVGIIAAWFATGIWIHTQVTRRDLQRENASPKKPLNSNRMTNQQLIEKVAAKTEFGKADVAVTVDCVLELIAETLRSNERVDLRGLAASW